LFLGRQAFMRQTVLAHTNIPVFLFRDAPELGRHLAAEILAGATEAHRAGRFYLLGCPSGRSLRSTYDALAALAGQANANLSALVIVMMDDYVLPADGGFEHCPIDAHYSCRGFALREIRDVLNAGLPPERQLPEANLWAPSPADPDEYEARIREAGGIDLFLVASGASDGHVAFNPPGTGVETRTRVIPLAESTRRDNLGTFPEFRSLDDVPRHGVSVGLATILDSRRVVLVIHGEHKAPAVRELVARGRFSPEWPASLVYVADHAHILLDEAAAQGLKKW
jgi:glucosamine-6-phosphate deaminase